MDGVAVATDKNSSLTIFTVNKNLEEEVTLEGDARDYADYNILEHIVLTNDDIMAGNTSDNPDNIAPKSNGNAVLEGGRLSATLPKASWNVIRMVKM